MVWKENAAWLPLADLYFPIGDAIYYIGLGVSYVVDYAPAAWDWMNNSAAPWLNNATSDAGNWIAKTADDTKEAGKKAVNWVKEKLGGGSGSPDPSNWNKRDELLNNASNKKLKNAIDQIYRPGAKIGDGGLADAIRYELRTGELIGGKHICKRVLKELKILKIL